MAILTKQQFVSYAKSKAGIRTFSAVVNKALNESKVGKKVSIFLSHSHKDKEMIEAGIVYFDGLPISIFVDWADETMPEATNGVTAAKIKKKIKENKKFVLLATNNAVVSKWCNWELGIGDIEKYSTDNIAIIPLADNNGNWDGNEYLQIYPRIEDADSEKYKGQYKIIYPNGQWDWLSEWLLK
jgi:hypothetical protein